MTLTKAVKSVLVLFLAMSAFAFGMTASGAATVQAKPYLTIHVGKSAFSDKGGTTTVRATERGLKNCAWTSAPKLKGFDAKVACSAAMARTAKLGRANTGRTYVLEITALSGKRSVVAHALITERGKPTATTTPIATAPTLKINLDPSFTQAPTNPLAVTFSASASASVVGVGLGQVSLPTGIFEFYSDGVLISGCTSSVGVGTADISGAVSCLINYQNVGTYQITTTYISSTSFVTATESFTIPPYVFTSGTVIGTVTDTPGFSTCNINQQCPSYLTWILNAPDTSGQVIINQDGFRLMSANGQTSCNATEVVENTNSGSSVTMSSSNCSITGNFVSGSPDTISYVVVGYVTAILTEESSTVVGNTMTDYWSN